MQIREDTEPKNFPLYCPKCKQKSLIEAKGASNHHHKAGSVAVKDFQNVLKISNATRSLHLEKQNAGLSEEKWV